VDVDYYNVIFAVQTDFKQPFWDMVDRDTADAIRVDETQNCVLRISPTLRGNPETAKIDGDSRRRPVEDTDSGEQGDKDNEGRENAVSGNKGAERNRRVTTGGNGDEDG